MKWPALILDRIFTVAFGAVVVLVVAGFCSVFVFMLCVVPLKEAHCRLRGKS